MKKKLVLDIIMTAIMLCLLNSNITGIALHEMLGIGVFVLFMVHKAFNLKWICTVTGKLFGERLNTRTKILYGLDVALLVLATMNVATGILISTCVFTEISADDIYATGQLHHILAYLLAAVLVLHIGFHWAYLRNAVKLPKGGLGEKIAVGALAAVLALVLLSSNTIRNLWVNEGQEDSHYQAGVGETELQTPTQTEHQKPAPTDPPVPTQPVATAPPEPTPTDAGAEETEDEEDKEDETAQTTETPTEPEIPTLEEYLSKLHCTGCGRRCLLTRPACTRGRNQQQDAVDKYNSTYDTNETYSSGGGRGH